MLFTVLAGAGTHKPFSFSFLTVALADLVVPVAVHPAMPWLSFPV
ncbi:hypothetical protein [Streptomyces sp.]